MTVPVMMPLSIDPDPVPAQGRPLGLARRGFAGTIIGIRVAAGTPGLPADEIERRLIELGFVEGAGVEVLHEAPLGRDPIAVRVAGATVALRRREAMAILTS